MTPRPVRAYVGLGSNLDQPRRQVTTAFAELAELPQTALAVRSGLYRSPPLGPPDQPDQPDYVNAVAGLDTALAPEALLAALQAIEAAHGRVRGERWGARTLDLDILAYGQQTVATATLRIPHPELPHRDFVLLPLQEVAADLELPGLGPVAGLVAALPRVVAQRIAD